MNLKKQRVFFHLKRYRNLHKKNGIDEDEMKSVIDHYGIQNSAEYDKSGKIRIGSFIKNHLGFLISEGIIKKGENRDTKDVVEDLKEYYKSNIGELPTRQGNTVNMDEMYKELIKHINKI